MIRAPSLHPSESIETVANSLISQGIRYKRSAIDDECPRNANCVTAVRYVLKKSFGVCLPHVYVGDLPRALDYAGWRVLSTRNIQPGDLICCYSETDKRIRHVAVAVDSDRVFHCSYAKDASVESMEKFLQRDCAPMKNVNEALLLADSRKYNFP